MEVVELVGGEVAGGAGRLGGGWQRHAWIWWRRWGWWTGCEWMRSKWKRGKGKNKKISEGKNKKEK
jgi:hypothetical protein